MLSDATREAENIKPDNFTLCSIVNYFSRLASLYHGHVVHGKDMPLSVF